MASDIDHLLYELDQLSLGTRPRPWHVHGDRAVRGADGQPVAVCTSAEGAAYIVALANEHQTLGAALRAQWTYLDGLPDRHPVATDRTPLGMARAHVQRAWYADRAVDQIIAFLRGRDWSLEEIAATTARWLDDVAEELGLEQVVLLGSAGTR